MVAALLVNVALLLAGMTAMVRTVLLDEHPWIVAVLFLLVVLAGVATGSTARRRRRGRPEIDRRHGERVGGAVRRLCLVGDLPQPAVRIVASTLPLSWTTSVPRRRARLHVTTELIDRLPERELEAVVGHELSHLAHHDALAMTVLAGPAIAILRGLRAGWEGLEGDTTYLQKLVAATGIQLLLVPPALVVVGVSRIVSRHRELAADRGAAMLTGSPAAVASALLGVSGQLEHASRADLRSVASRDPLHLLPAVQREPRGLRRLWATHPRLDKRVAQLERMESALQSAR